MQDLVAVRLLQCLGDRQPDSQRLPLAEPLGADPVLQGLPLDAEGSEDHLVRPLGRSGARRGQAELSTEDQREADEQAVVDVRHARVPLQLPVEVVLQQGGGVQIGAPDALLLVGEPTVLCGRVRCRVHVFHCTRQLLEL